ncbi:hypothetical protein BJY00DRAFT_313968 [Aspergillus carlsbadensis]|nr:hypothetical protein BJY00DRAFT_313968 [Aspergillus carlsbadensis]
MPCTLDSDDVRIKRRRKISPNSESRVSTLLRSSLNTPRGGNTPLLPSPRSASVLLTSNPDIVGNSLLDDSAGESLWTNLDLELGSEIPFLNEMFMQGFPAPSESIANIDGQSDASIQNPSGFLEGAIANHGLYEIQGFDPSILEGALTAYFDFASLVLPILDRDAFMADYGSRRISSSLIFAVACRGCPFITAPDKWKSQQQFAFGFRQAFLEAQSNTASKQTIRLDDLEALALMVGFAYDGSHGTTASGAHSQLGALFLTHHSLVLFTLQYQISWPPMMAKAAERKDLLMWHVYGLDAFYCLDHGVTSRIEKEDIQAAKPSESSIGHEEGSYLDSMISLAALARSITRTICSPRAKRRGVKLPEVEHLYEQLSKWGHDSCPSQLRLTENINSDSAGREGGGQFPHTINWNLLRRIVISLLELSCYMAVERCLEVGIQEWASAEGEALELCVRYKTLKAANQIFQALQYMDPAKSRGQQPIEGQNRSFALVDLSPSILRNMSCGASYWFCIHSPGVNPLLNQRDWHTATVPESYPGKGLKTT